MKKFFFFLLLVSVLSAKAQTICSNYLPSGISFLYWDNPNHIELEYGRTYCSSDVSYIKSGSLSISEDGTTLTFNQLVVECDEGSTSSLLCMSIFYGYQDNAKVTIKLEGENKLKTNNGYEVLYLDGIEQLTITGDGSLTLSSSYIDISLSSGLYGVPNGELVIDNTSVTCLGYLSVSSCRNIFVKSSRFEGNSFTIDNLTMENCSIREPHNGWFDPEARMIKNENGDIANHFLIAPLDDKEVPSFFTYKGECLFCGRSYTTTEISSIQSGSITISDDGTVMTFANLYLNDESEANDDLFEMRGESRNFPLTVNLNGENNIFTSSNTVMELNTCTLILTGDGFLATQSNKYDFLTHGCNIDLDNTSLTCKGPIAIGDEYFENAAVLVKHSTFTGIGFFRLESLTLINSAFVTPVDAFFDPNDRGGSQLKDAEGNNFRNFEIKPVEGDFSNRVSPWDFGMIIIEKGTARSVNISMKNDGEEPVREVSYVLSVNGAVLPEQIYELSEPYTETGKNFSFPVSFPASEMAGNVEALLMVTKVNGMVNTSNHKTAKGIVATIDQAVIRRVVVEEFTGTWCGWCPRGMVALDMLNKEFGDSVITIAVHVGDPMWASYPYYSLYFPNASIDRGSLIDPYYGSSGNDYGIRDDVCFALKDIAPAAISVSAAWTDETQTAIKVETETNLLVDIDFTQYKIGYALLEDGMKGTDSDWAQYNIYSGSHTDDPYLQPLTTLPQNIKDIEYDHVPVDHKGFYYGWDRVERKNSYLWDITANELIQDKSRLSVVVILINGDGKIVNAAKANINAYEPSVIRDVLTEKDLPSTVFSINGYRVASSLDNSLHCLPKGIYIIDGRKIMVR